MVDGRWYSFVMWALGPMGPIQLGGDTVSNLHMSSGDILFRRGVAGHAMACRGMPWRALACRGGMPWHAMEGRIRRHFKAISTLCLQYFNAMLTLLQRQVDVISTVFRPEQRPHHADLSARSAPSATNAPDLTDRSMVLRLTTRFV